MSSQVPIISVTSHIHHSSTSSESDSESSGSNDMDYSRSWGRTTDVEDFGSQADLAKLDKKNVKERKKLCVANPDEHNYVTDVEDYSTDEESDAGPVYPELKISLQEFLQHPVEELKAVSNGEQEKVEHRSGNFLEAQQLNTIQDYLTDCEEYNTISDCDMDNECAKSVCGDLNEVFSDQGRVSIADAIAGSKESGDSEGAYDDISTVSDVSDIGNGMLACAQLTHNVSEDEMLELSGDEEVCQIAFSDSDSRDDDGNGSEEDILSINCGPPLDVKFVTPLQAGTSRSPNFLSDVFSVAKTSASKMFLDVCPSPAKEEVLTDIEHLDDENEDSFDDDEKPIPQAVILAPGDDGGCVTDCEDMFCDDPSDNSSNYVPATIDLSVLPQPQREVILLQEDKFGDTITSVMPMEEEYQFGIDSKIKQECCTDSEEYSCADDEASCCSIAENFPHLQTSNMIESDIVISNEVIKTPHSKRLEIQSNTEPITDVEEIFMDGTNSRRKKLKTRSMSKGKLRDLEVAKSRVDGGTDIEDLDLSDTGLNYSDSKPVAVIEQNSTLFTADKTTDIEDLSNEEDNSSVSEVDLPCIDSNKTNLRDYDSSSKNVVVSLETSAAGSKYRKSPPSLRYCQISHPANHQQQQLTDTEDIQLPSDTEDLNVEPAVACLCSELSDILNESCTIVHEKCSNRFNDEAEKHQIKGMPREALTDVEYVESDESAARGSK